MPGPRVGDETWKALDTVEQCLGFCTHCSVCSKCYLTVARQSANEVPKGLWLPRSAAACQIPAKLETIWGCLGVAVLQEAGESILSQMSFRVIWGWGKEQGRSRSEEVNELSNHGKQWRKRERSQYYSLYCCLCLKISIIKSLKSEARS